MESHGIIRKAKGSVLWNSPVHVVTKKPNADGLPQFRIVIDYRNVNQVIVGDQWPLPRIPDLINRLNGVKYFSTIDLKSGYHQIKFREGRGEIAAFSIPGKGQYIPNRLLFGLKTSPAQFQRLMDRIAQELPFGTCMVYIDDLLVLGKTKDEHYTNLSLTLEKLREYNLKINKEKSRYLQGEIKYLGYIISEGKIGPDLAKQEVIRNFPVPTKKKELQRFLGLINYYRRFMPDTAGISIPLLRLLKKTNKFQWTEDCQAAFAELRDLLLQASALRMPDFERPFILTTDASEYALGAILSQRTIENSIETDQPIAYDSRVLNQAEKNYSAIERELLALVWAVKTFRTYLYGQKFTVVTDHKPLTYMHHLRIDSIRLTKMRLKLMDYDFEIEYKPGNQNLAADALSRILAKPLVMTREDGPEAHIRVMTRRRRALESLNSPEIQDKRPKMSDEQTPGTAQTESLDKSQEDRSKVPEEETPERPRVVEGGPVKAGDKLILIRKQNSQEESPLTISVKRDLLIFLNRMMSTRQFLETLKDILKDLEFHELLLYQEDVKAVAQNLTKFKAEFKEVFNDTPFFLNLINAKQQVTDEKVQMNIIKDFHNSQLSGHPGAKRTMGKIARFYTWGGMRTQIQDYVKHCESCQKNKLTKLKPNPMKITSTASKAMEVIFMDVVGPMNFVTEQGNRYIITFLDDLTKYLVAIPVPNHEAVTVSEVLAKDVILHHGVPESLVSDNAPEFVGEVFKRTCKLLNIKKIHTTPYHPQANRVERVHRELKTYLRHYCSSDRDHWDRVLPFFVFAHNTTIHTSTKYTPFELMYGRKVSLPGVLTRKPEPIYNYDDYVTELKYQFQKSATMAKENMIQAKEVNKKGYDKNAKERSFDVGDLILLKNPSKDKGEELFVGPYPITKQTSDATYQIKVKGKLRSVNVQRLRPFYN